MKYELLHTDPKGRSKHVKMVRSLRRKEPSRPRSAPVKRITFKKQYISQALYYIAVLAIIVGAFLFFSKLSKTSNTIKLQNLELKSTQYKLQELNSSYDTVLKEKAATSAEKSAQDAKVQELEKAKQELERQLQSRLAEKARVASIQTTPVYAASLDHNALMTAAGIAPSDFAAVEYIVSKESGWRSNAWGPMTNLGQAYGLCQSLPASKMASAGADYMTNPVTQLKWCAQYSNKYGGWWGSYSFWTKNFWW